MFYTMRIVIINTSMNKCTSYSIQNIDSYELVPGTAITWFLYHNTVILWLPILGISEF